MAIEPVTREERFLAAAGGRSVTPPTPITRKEQLLQGIIDAVKSGGATPDVIEGAVNDYLNANPVQPGATTEQAAQIEQNKTDIADLQTEVDELKESGGNGSGQNLTRMEPAEDDIPKVFFGGALQQTKDEAVVPFRYISKTEDFSGYAEIKAQGNSSMNYPKKNQTVKMFADEACESKMKKDFKGWGKQNKHVYKANWIDLSHARNVVSARLWADVVKTRANYADLPELFRTTPNQGAVDGFPVKVYAAGVYQGRYTLNIPKDKWTFNMDDELNEHCVLCGENYGSGCFRAAAKIDESDWTDEIHDTVPESIKTRWNEVISFVMNSTDEEFKANLNQYFFVDSLIDYYLFGLASCGLDAFGKNQIYATYDGQKWIASMYDMDSTWGLYWNGSKFVATDYARTSYEDFAGGRQGNLLYIRLEQLFYEELQTRWAELKNGALSITNIINRFERFTDIAPAELVKEDYASTTGGGKFTGIPSYLTNNIQQIRAFALARQAWTNAYIAALVPAVPVPCTGISLDKSTLNFTGEGTQTLTATVTPDGCTDLVTWESDNTSVVVVANGAVTSVGDGSAIVTAKCGNYTASCSVSVAEFPVPEPVVARKEVGIELNAVGYAVGANGDVTENSNAKMSEEYFSVAGYAFIHFINVAATYSSFAFYDNSKGFIKAFSGNPNGLAAEIPENAKYVRCSFFNAGDTATIVLTNPVSMGNVSWSENATGSFKNNQLLEAGGDSYFSDSVSIPNDTKAVFSCNVGSATFTYKHIIVYDATGAMLGKFSSNTVMPSVADLSDVEGADHVRFMAFPNNSTANNAPANQLKILSC